MRGRGLLLQDVLGGTCVLASLGSLWRSASRSGLAVWRKLSEHSLERYAYVHIINHWWSNYTLQCAKCWATQCVLGQIVCMCEHSKVCLYVLLIIMTVDSCKPILCHMDSVLSHLLDHMLACVTNVPPTRSLHGGPPLLSCWCNWVTCKFPCHCMILSHR